MDPMSAGSEVITRQCCYPPMRVTAAEEEEEEAGAEEGWGWVRPSCLASVNGCIHPPMRFRTHHPPMRFRSHHPPMPRRVQRPSRDPQIGPFIGALERKKYSGTRAGRAFNRYAGALWVFEVSHPDVKLSGNT